MNDARRLIFCNLLNGNTAEQVARAYHKTPDEINEIFRFVVRKIKSYCHERYYPHIPCDTLAEARHNHLALRHILERVNLDTKPHFIKIITHVGLSPTDMNDIVFRGAR